MQQLNRSSFTFAIFMVLAIVSCVFISESMAGKNKGEDIILYNGNIIVRSGKGKGKGGNIVVANSPSVDVMPYWGGNWGRRR